MKTINDFWKEAQGDSSYWAELAKAAIAVELHTYMEKNEISQVELAQHVGVSKQYISKVLGGDANLSIETISKLFFAVGRRLNTASLPIESTHCDSLSNAVPWNPQIFKVPDKTLPVKEWRESAVQKIIVRDHDETLQEAI